MIVEHNTCMGLPQCTKHAALAYIVYYIYFAEQTVSGEDANLHVHTIMQSMGWQPSTAYICSKGAKLYISCLSEKFQIRIKSHETITMTMIS